jgi:inositol 1,4,5-triphosphate receptor type 3
MINYGVRAGGGIGDELGKISFLDSSKDYYIKTFFFNMIFQIIIVLVLGNIFLGVIVDTFAELRDLKAEFENDLKDVCFICQLTRDKASSKLIDFEKHTNEEHLMWNYVDFIIYLFINNYNDFKQFELYAYEKIKENDLSWIPIEENNEE